LIEGQICDFRRGSFRAVRAELTEVPEGVQEFDELGHAVLEICKWTDRQTDVDRNTSRDRVPRRV